MDAESLEWSLAVLGIASIVAGASLVGTTGDVSVLLLTGLGATTAWFALHDGFGASRPRAVSGSSRSEPVTEGSA